MIIKCKITFETIQALIVWESNIHTLMQLSSWFSQFPLTSYVTLVHSPLITFQLCVISKWRLGNCRLDCTVLVSFVSFLLCSFTTMWTLTLFFPSSYQKYAHTFSFSYRRSTFATYILSLGGNRQNDRNRVKEIFSPVFSALVDALVLRAQVTSWKLS